VKRRRIFWILLGCGVFAVALALLWPGEREPRYQANSLSEWLLYERPYSARPTDPNPQFDAIRQIGTNAIPWLLKWVRYEPPTWRKELETLAAKRGFKLEDPKAERVDAALFGFLILGRQASPAIPELTAMMNDPAFPNIAWYAAMALGDIGPEALPSLLAVLTNRQVMVRRQALVSIAAMKDLGTNSGSVVAGILPCLKDTDLSFAAAAAQALSRLQLEPEIVVPALRDSLRGPQPYVRRAAVKALESFKERAVSARPELEAALSDSDATVREWATNALKAVLGTNSVQALKTE
jgi:HEAT repeat protein